MAGQTREQKKAQQQKSKDQQKASRRRFFKDCTEAKVRRTLKSNHEAGVHLMLRQAADKKDDQLVASIKRAVEKIAGEDSVLSQWAVRVKL